MLKRLCVFAVLILLPAAPAFAQRAEVSFTVGWTFSDGVSFSNALPVNGFVYNRVDPKDSVSFGIGVGVFVTPQAEIEFLWNRQPSKLEVGGGGGPILSGDMTVDNFHGNFVYNAGEPDSTLRPYIYIGAGASNYGDADFGPQAGLGGRTIPGLTKFSWAIGTGVKFYPGKAVGVRAGVRWVPTYIKTDSVGWWCDPYWGCGPVGNVQYSNQFELGGGVTFKFEP
jgi:Outer membrane protein beta-barrel domain